MQIVIINGRAGVGKDQFVTEVKNLIGEYRCYNHSTVEFTKFVAICAGWRQDKTPENRLFLSKLKKLLTEWDDIPYKKALIEVRDCERYAKAHKCEDQSVLFIHCREPEEIERFVTGLDAHTLLIKRAAADEVEQSNPSDENVENYAYDVIVDNNGTIEELRESARTYIEQVLGLTI